MNKAHDTATPDGAEAWYAAKRKMFEIIKRRCIEEGPQENKRGEGINESAKYLARHYMNQRAEGALGKATTAENVFTAPEKWNAEGWLLGLPDGLVCELRRGRSGVRAQKPEDLIDLRAGVVPDWKCPAPVFFSLLNYFADGDEYFMNDILAGLASGLVGKAYRRIYVLLGPSGCGKSRLLMIASALIGDYVTALSREAFASRTQGSNKYALGNLPDKRMALAAELEGGSWHGAFIKALVSGDLLESEQKYQKAHPFKPVVTLFLMANPAQMARSYVRDNALLERLVIWPFTKRLDEARTPTRGKAFGHKPRAWI